MNTTIYKHLFQTAQELKRAIGIKNYGAFKKKLKRSLFRLIYTKKYTASEIVDIMKSMGMKNGSIVFIHSSMTEFYNYIGTSEELIRQILNVIGDDGTLMMPAYPNFETNKVKEGIDFDVLETPSGAGYLSETFRKYPGVKRSINFHQSVCAYGKLADYFISEHQYSVTSWDEMSPYYKMSQFNTLVFALGLNYFLGTMIHCTESILRSKYLYFQLFFTKEKVYTYRDSHGQIGKQRYLTHDLARKRSKRKIIKKYFDKSQFHTEKLSNLRIEMVDAKYTLNLYLDLAERGITMYSVPSPKKYKDSSLKFLKV